MQAEWQWSEWPSQSLHLEGLEGCDASGDVDSRIPRSWWQRAWSWDDYIVMKGSTVRVELSGAELGDADLAALVAHLDAVLRRYVERTEGKYTLNIDLSCNLYISDDGVTEHLAPFLQRWPACHRLKLYKTSIGDGALAALSAWAAGGHAHELHLSDLGGQVTGEAVFAFLGEVHRQGKYPYWNSDGVRCALWLRLEHNAVPNTDKLVSRAQSHGMSLAVLQKPDLGQVRPGTPSGRGSKDVPAVNLVLFHKQELRVSRQWIGSMVPMAPVPPELRDLLCGGSHAAITTAAPVVAAAAGPWAVQQRRPPFLEQFLGPSQRRSSRRPEAPRPSASCAHPEVAAGPGESAGRLRRTLAAVTACSVSGDGEVFGRWRWHLQKAEDPEWEAHRIARMASARLCDEGYLENADSCQTLSPPPLSDATSSGSSSDPVALDGSGGFASKQEGEESNDDVGIVLTAAVEPPLPEPAPPTAAHEVAAAPCA